VKLLNRKLSTLRSLTCQPINFAPCEATARPSYRLSVRPVGNCVERVPNLVNVLRFH
jgi:hypothetical protein